jgi:cytochrome c biogenesis protein
LSRKKNLLLSFFSSVRLTIFLLIIIAVLSVIGTFIPQQESAQDFARTLSPGTVSILMHLQIFDIYHSFTFYFFLALLSVNLIVCSWNRLPYSLQQIKKSPRQIQEGLFDDAAPENIVLMPGSKENVMEDVLLFLKKKLGTVETSESGQATVLFSEKNRFSHLGVYLVHMSVLSIIAGVIVGSVTGFEGYVNILEGDSVQTVDLRGGKGTKKLDFFIRCDRFTVEYYDSGAPKTYRSDLSFVKDGRVLQQGPLVVNHPLEQDKIRFYQSSFGQIPNGRAFVTYRTGGGKEKGLMLKAGERVNLPESRASLEVVRLEANLMEMGPALKLRITSSNTDVQFWIFKHIKEIRDANPGIMAEVPLFDPGLFKPYTFSLVRLEEQYYTGLQVVSDPGIPLVAAGGILMMAGLLVIFFMPHRRVWARIDESGGKARVTVVGRSNRNRPGLKRQIDRIISEMKQELKP